MTITIRITIILKAYIICAHTGWHQHSARQPLHSGHISVAHARASGFYIRKPSLRCWHNKQPSKAWAISLVVKSKSCEQSKTATAGTMTTTITLLFLILDHLTFWLISFSRSLSASPLSKNMRIFPWLTTEAAPWKPQDAPQHIHLQPSGESGWGMYLHLFHPKSYIIPPIWPLGLPRNYDNYEDIPKACLQLKDSEALQTAEVNQFLPC